MVSQVHVPLRQEQLDSTSTTARTVKSPMIPSPSFTLSLGGVDFRLVPAAENHGDCSSTRNSPMLSLAGNNNNNNNNNNGGKHEMVMNLSSFTGTLRVSLSNYNNNNNNNNNNNHDNPVAVPTTRIAANNDDIINTSANTAMVEESPSPVRLTNTNHKSVHGMSPRQKTLPFVKAGSSNKPKLKHRNSKHSGIKKVDQTPNHNHTNGHAGPDVIPPSTGQSTKQENRKQQKRTVPEIATNPIPSPPRHTKKTRRNAITVDSTTATLNKITEDVLPTLGQATQLSQSDDTQPSVISSPDEIGTSTTAANNAIANSGTTSSTTTGAPPSSTLVRELVRQAEAFSESGPDDCIHDDHDDDEDDGDHTLRFGSTQHVGDDNNNMGNNNNNNDDNAIMEIDEEGNLKSDTTTATSPHHGIPSTTTTPAAPKRKGQPPPSSRWGHTMTQLDGDRVLIYGGQNIDTSSGRVETLSDIHVYDKCKRVWNKPVNCEGVPRQWHTSSFLPERQLLISFGGESYNAKTGKVQTTDQVMVLDTDIMLWYPPTVSGAVPSGRSGHTATLFPNTNELVVFGGVRGSKWQNSVAVLDISSWKWSAPKAAGAAPRPRSYHSATALLGASGSSPQQKNRLVIFGGNNRDASFDTIHVLESDGKKWSWSHPSASGEVPKARSGHCATLLDDKKTILIYGGWDLNADVEPGASDDDMIFSDSYLLDTDTWTWRKGPKPTFAGDGSSADLADSLATDGGSKRVGHKAVLTNGENGPEVLVFGGRVLNDEFANDFQTLSVPGNTPVRFTAS